MTLKQFEMYTEQRSLTQQAQPESPRGTHHNSGNRDSGESLDSMVSSMATNSAGPRLARAPDQLTNVPEKWLKRSLMLDAVPVQGTYLAKSVLVRPGKPSSAFSASTARVPSIVHRGCVLILLEM
jgi:hypothetical protein